MLRTVVGIVGDVKQRNLIEASTPTVYFYTRQPYAKATFVIRTSVPPATLAQPAVAAIRAIDPEQPVGDIRTMGQVLDGRLTSQRFSALLPKSLRESRCCSPRSESTACSRTSCADAAARSESEPCLARGHPTSFVW